jgi:nucleoside-diphosphate-sugar epimerase
MLDWRARIEVEDGVASTVEWLRSLREDSAHNSRA